MKALGRNRYRACEVAGVKIAVEQYTGTTPLAYVLSANLERRHLDESQRAMVAAKVANMPEGRPPNSANLHSLVSLASAAEKLNVSRRSVADATKVQDKAAPEIIARVEEGSIPVSVAAKVADMPMDRQVQVAAMKSRAATRSGGVWL